MAKKRGNGEGSIYQLADGRWCAIIPAKFSRNGKRQTIYGSIRNGTNTREAVAKKLHKYLAGDAGPVIRPDRHTVESYLLRWLSRLEQDGELRPKTLESYRYTVKSLIVPLIGAVKLQALEADHVRYMMRALTDAKKAPRTVRYARSILGIALQAAVVEKLFKINPASRQAMGIVRREKTPRKVEVVDAASITATLAKVSDPADRLLLKTVATFGLRIGEALGLQWKNVDLDAKSIHIAVGAQRQPKSGESKSRVVLAEVKTDNSRRTLLVPDPLIEELKAHRVALLKQRLEAGSLWQDHDLVFPTGIGTPQDSRNVLRLLHRAQGAAGVPKSSLHRLRHSAATYMLSQGVPIDVISSILGHSSIQITRDFYAQFELAQQKSAAEIMGRAFAPKKV